MSITDEPTIRPFKIQCPLPYVRHTYNSDAYWAQRRAEHVATVEAAQALHPGVRLAQCNECSTFHASGQGAFLFRSHPGRLVDEVYDGCRGWD